MPALARVIVAVVSFGLYGVMFGYVLSSGVGVWQTVQGGCCLLVLWFLQVFYFGRPSTSLHSLASYAVLAVQACLALLPLPQFGQSWIGVPSLLAGSALLVLPPATAWIVFGVIVAGSAWVQALLTGSVLDVAFVAVCGAVVALAVYVLTRLITELPEARVEPGRAAVAGERSRFARELDELLGVGLATIESKCAAVCKLLVEQPARARQELGDILTIARHALADVRLISRGYRQRSFEEEFRTTESALRAAGVDVRIELDHGELSRHVRTLLVAVLRTGVVNVLRLSSLKTCEITIRQASDTVSLDIVTDSQVDRPGMPEPAEDNGLDTLAARVAALGGSLVAGRPGDRRYGLHLSIPVGRERAQDGGSTPAGEHDEPVPRLTNRFTTALMQVVCCGFVVAAVLHLLRLTHDPTEISTSVGYLMALLLLQLCYVSRPATPLHSTVSYVVLVLQAVLVYLPLIQFGPHWVSIPGFLAGTMLLVLRPVAAWAGFVVVVASVGWAQTGLTGNPLETTIATVITGLITYGLTWMVRSMTELRATRQRLTQVAVDQERRRFARDLHDLLGLSLSAIILKTELAAKLLTAEPRRADQELTEIADTARLALIDVQLVASGYRDLSLDEEARSAESVLTAADIDVRMELHYGELPVEVRTVLATVLREGVTNVLRHSKGANCRITVRQDDDTVLLEITNDGMTRSAEMPSTGSGISNLSDRVTTLGGELTTDLNPDGTFRLQARVPV
ncbi:MAG TPA: histidine kinase [Pseudonocardiaceae bacterium]|nr:histidine kinase [Pseudonocardiaceae bacterium]